eukprot:CAMPEP_0185027470 /NCGR_PEP_ID=MMETSP1103-20130426/12557_1 /TAXON_ID=36769 /ORGANISM="Paraphysomonas bandaiensis, Strain Caron Lab Isolate" /LENGTH=144 /DNA_ID=CAMNT_0027561483 /DNA_START=297 /DNA_END=731 /DNA_ORIENTATION=-
MAPMYYRNASAAIVCFDITNEDSFTKMKDWVEELKQNVPAEKIVLAIACTKSDLESERVVSRSRAENFARRVDASLYETSAKDNYGVDDIFRNISELIVKKLGDSVAVSGAPRTGVIGSQAQGQQLGAKGAVEAPKGTSDGGCC